MISRPRGWQHLRQPDDVDAEIEQTLSKIISGLSHVRISSYSMLNVERLNPMNMLGEVGNEVQRFEMLEVALDGVRRFALLMFVGEWAALGVLGTIENMAVGADVDEAFQAEGATAHVLDQAFDGGGWRRHGRGRCGQR